MTLAFSDLITPDTKEQAWDALLAFLEAEGLPVTSWQDGSVPKTLTEGEAEAYADMATLVAAIAKGGYLDTAEGAWLTFLAEDIYGLTGKAAVQTQGTFVLTDAGGGPHVVTAGQLIVSGPGGLTYRNLAGGTVPLNGSLPLLFGAEAVGAAYNLANSSSLQLITSLPTVSVTNPGSLGGTWITQQGANEESDASLRTRCKARWPGSGYILSTAATYEAAALTASAEVTKVKVFPNTPDPGKVLVVLAGTSGPVSGGAVTAVTTYIQDRLPLCVNATVQSAVAVIIPVVAELQCEAAYAGTVKAAGEAALARLQASLPIGGAPGATFGYVYRAAIIEALMEAQGMVNVELSMPNDDAALLSSEIATFTPTLTVLAVS
jgi:uncharacterized phage protein gp47/JayE